MSNWLQRVIGGMIPQANTSPIIYDDWGNPIPGDPTVNDTDIPPVSAQPPVRPKRNVGGIIGGMLNGAIDAGATQNVALGGPTDMFRAMQAAQEGGMAREDRNIRNARQGRMDQDSRIARDAQAAENLAQAEYWKKRAEMEASDRKYQAAQPKVRETYFNSATGRRHYNDTDEPVNPNAPGKPAEPTVDVGVGPTGSTLDYGPGFEMGGTQFPSYGKTVPMAPGKAAELKRADASLAQATAPQKATNPTTASLALDAAGGDPEKALSLLRRGRGPTGGGGEKPAPKSVFVGIENRKVAALRNAEQKVRKEVNRLKNPAAAISLFGGGGGEFASADEAYAWLENEKKNIQDSYEQEIIGAGGSVSPQSPASVAAPKPVPQGAPTATDAKGNKVYWDGQAWQPAPR